MLSTLALYYLTASVAAHLFRASTHCSYLAFYNAFLLRYLPCYSCPAADRVFAMLDTDKDGVSGL